MVEGFGSKTNEILVNLCVVFSPFTLSALAISNATVGYFQ